MRLTFKITLFFIGGICLIMAWQGYSRIDRESGLFEAQMRRDHYALGQPLAVMVRYGREQFGEDFALELVERSNQASDRLRVRWVWAQTGTLERLRPEAPLDLNMLLEEGRAVSWIDRDQIEAGRLYTYVPVVVEEGRVGAVELSESFAREQAYVRASKWRIVWTTLLMLVMASGLAMVTGLLFIARPVDALVARARSIGKGDLKTPLKLEGHGELSVLAMEMNLMSDQLAGASEKLEEETAARIQALQQLRHADRLKTVGTLAAGLAHELGTPLNVISMRAAMIEDREVEGDEVERNARIIGEQTSRITKIIRQLMDFARVRHLSKTRMEVGPVVEQAIELIRPIAEKRQVVMELSAEPQAFASDVDADQITQVLTNLLVNAMHACQQQGGRVEVALRAVHRAHPEDEDARERDYVLVEVKDDGVGMSEDALEQVFEPFFTTKAVGEGSGLGLSVSYGIVREHGGWIDVTSTEGQGSTFGVYLPIEERE
ncbi:HAMP domain-containing histidine kinase [Lujinxingia vulgaris]|uniref:histidine kinase n=1 Tax=Lujinxingia vulgaris TaxID=2600176 RepID=A0A5C6XEL9_9DELT|nr:HAMP domain-containing sensor histidine kinase [Lujinxingia vulgaris]TXD35582.1 HAMP domain-containing histidine kinase [Lujinxingia vulgaris]